MMIIHLQHSLVCNDTAHISCITTNYSAYKYNENVHPFRGTPFASSQSHFFLSWALKEAAAARCQTPLGSGTLAGESSDPPARPGHTTSVCLSRPLVSSLPGDMWHRGALNPIKSGWK